jgi:hypothetical protein
MTFKNVYNLFTLIIYYKLLKVPSYRIWCYYNSTFCKGKHLQRVAAIRVKARMDSCFIRISGCLIPADAQLELGTAVISAVL